MDSQTHYPTMPNFPVPKINSNRPSLSVYRETFVGGDFDGLQLLANEIYSFVGRCNEQDGPFPVLIADVTRLVKDDNDPSGGYHPDAHGGWIGAAAYTFRSAFTSDAAMMNGLNRTLCSMADKIDNLASGLSSLESSLEQSLERVMQKGITGFDISWLTTSGSGTCPVFQLTVRGAAQVSNSSIPQSDVLRLCNQLGKPYFDKANSLRMQTATTLAALGEALVEALYYYRAHSALVAPSSGDINVLLTTGQAGDDDKATSKLEDRLKAETGSLSKSALNDPALAAELTGLGVKAQNVGSLIGDLKDFKEADTALKSTKGFLGLVGDAVPLLMAIGLGA